MNNEDEQEKETLNTREIAEILGVSRSAIQKAEEKALEKLRKALRRKGITKEDFFGDE